MTSVSAISQTASVSPTPLSCLTSLPKVLASQSTNVTLDQLPKGAQAAIVRIDTSAQGGKISLRLMELGFVEGEIVRVVAKGYFAGTPIAVRIGGTTFALRRFEAALILVSPLVQPASASPTHTGGLETS